MRGTLFLAALLLFGCSGNDSFEFGGFFDTDPFEAQRDGRIATDMQLDSVAPGAPVMLRWTAPGFTTFAWTLDAPAGSAAALTGAATATPSFTPDVEGVYRVAVTASDGATVAREMRRLTAASAVGNANCASCHLATGVAYDRTRHGQVMVDCEDCHGPGSEHEGDPRTVALTYRAELCAVCHTGGVPDVRAQWGTSAHADPPPAGALDDPSCYRCHAAQSFVESLDGEPLRALESGVPGVTCQACHDNHQDQTPVQLRAFGTTPLTSGGAFAAGRGAACVLCHQSDVPDPAAYADALGAFPCAVQADMLAARGAVSFGQAFGTGFHGTGAFRLRPFTGNPADSDTPDACVVCHMAPSGADDLGGHSVNVRQGGVELATGNCDRCHAGLNTFDRLLNKDFDGDGRRQGVQTEVARLLDVVWNALRSADTGGALSRPGGSGTEIFVDPNPALSTTVLRRAAYNVNFVALDGSLGVHNTTYAVNVLHFTYEAVTGVPYRTAFPLADRP